MEIEYLSDKEWAFLLNLSSRIKSARGRPATKHRQTFDAIFWVANASSPWRALPTELGKWNTVYRQFKRWSDAGLWQTAINELRKNKTCEPLNAMLENKVLAALKRAENQG